MIIYDRQLTLAETADVARYLDTKYRLGVVSTGAMSEMETGNVTGGAPSTLLPTSEPVASGRSNRALASNGELAFAQDYIGPGSPHDFRPHRVNDGLYSDLPEGAPPIQEPWIGATLDSFIGIRLEGPATIDRIGFEDQFDARRNGSLLALGARRRRA